MMIKHLPLLVVALIGSLTASAQTTKRIPLPPSQNPTNANLPFSAAVWAGDTLCVSGWLDPDLDAYSFSVVPSSCALSMCSSACCSRSVRDSVLGIKLEDGELIGGVSLCAVQRAVEVHSTHQ
jgi:hypothetical protein